MRATGTATLDGDVYIGDAPSDSVYVRGSLVGDGTGAFLQVDQDRSNSFELTLALTDPTADQTITFPDETGEVLTTVSEISALPPTVCGQQQNKPQSGLVLTPLRASGVSHGGPTSHLFPLARRSRRIGDGLWILPFS